jgi:large subunit ribosomal protein L4
MPTVKVYNLENKEVGEIELPDEVFGVEFNEALVHEAVRNFLANHRRGTVATKTRGDVSGSGKKLWRQKGTGRARVGSIRSPLWRKGGTVHGPQSRDWSYELPKKMRRGALRSALSERLREGNLVVIDEFNLEKPKTKEFAKVMSNFGLLSEKKKPMKTLIIDSIQNKNLVLSSRNLPKVKIVDSLGVNIYDVVYHEKLLVSKSAIERLNELLNPNREKGESEEQ